VNEPDLPNLFDGTSFDLLDKREVQIVGVTLDRADLNAIAVAAADVLGLDRSEVLVTDFLDRVLTFDVLRSTIYPHQLLTSNEALLARLAEIPGVSLDDGATVEARGMLGWIAADSTDKAEIAEAIRTAQSRANDLLSRIAKRVRIFSTGAELVSGEVKDTNAATIAEGLVPDGFNCHHGGALRDDEELIAGAIRRAIDDGYGLVITTGGVGAEAKDCSVEAVLRIDPQAATPYLAHFETGSSRPGHDRHVKDGVRIAVGRYQGSLIVALPGPNDEVTAALPVLRRGLADQLPPGDLAESIARTLRGILRSRMQGSHVWNHGATSANHPGVRRITKELTESLQGLRRAIVSATEPGVVAGLATLHPEDAPDPAGRWTPLFEEGTHVAAGTPILEVIGTAWEIAVAGDHVLGPLGVAGGIAKRALELRTAAPPGLVIVCGAWKKLPAAMKPVLRAGLDVAGIGHRLVPGEFVYIDKNVVRMIGSIEATVKAGRALGHGPVAIQVENANEALQAVEAGCGIVMVDTGNLHDLASVQAALVTAGKRSSVQLAFGGGIDRTSLLGAHEAGAEIVDIGRAILNAPLWDLHLIVDP
jgi:molybdenum cofactor synthesis domain-containing protein